jgi:hypothetical protein
MARCFARIINKELINLFIQVGPRLCARPDEPAWIQHLQRNSRAQGALPFLLFFNAPISNSGWAAQSERASPP